MAENPTPQEDIEPEVQGAVDAAPATQDAVASRPSSLPFFVIVTVCAAVTFLGMLALAYAIHVPQQQAAPIDQRPDTAVRPVAAEQPVNVVPLAPAEALRQADRELVAENVAAAARIYRQLAATGGTAVPESLRYRQAICAEALGDYESALSTYRDLARHSNTPLALGASIAQARICFNTDRLDLAQSVLCQFMLMTLQGDAAEALHADAAHLLAHVLARQALGTSASNLLDDRTVVRPHLTWSPSQALSLVQGARVEMPAVAEGDAVVDVAHRFGNEPEDVQINAQLADSPVPAVLDRLSQEAEIPLAWTDAARDAIYGRTVAVSITNTNLATLLDLILQPLGLTWTTENNTIHIFGVAELESAISLKARRATAMRALRYAVATYPDHRLAAAAHLALGNISLAADQFDEAAAYYGQVVRQFQRSAWKGEAWFNHAKVLLLLERRDESRDAFFRVVDQSRGHALEGVAYLYVGRLMLEDGDFRQAVKPLIRAVSLSANTDNHAIAAATLATAYLLAASPSSANAVLMDNRQAMQQSSQREVGALLAALARYQAAATPDQTQRAGHSLVSALAHVRPEDFFGYHGYMLLGQTYQQLGLAENAAALYRASMKSRISGPLRDRVLLSLAEYELYYGNRQSAKSLLAQVVEDGGASPRDQAQLKLAELAFDEAKFDRCLAMCTALLPHTNIEPEIKRAVLRLMGRVYEQRAEHYKAALCFAGMLPDNAMAPAKEATP